MSDLTKVQESLQGAGFSADQVAAIINGAEQIRQKADAAVRDEGIRQKSFDQAEAQNAITALTEQFNALQQQLSALELAKTAQKALDAASDAGPKQEVYTLDDIQAVVQKAVAEALAPFIEGQKQEANATVTLWDHVQQLRGVAETAQKSLSELTGDLPRALQNTPPTRYVGAPTTQAAVPQSGGQVAGENPFSWVDQYMQNG